MLTLGVHIFKSPVLPVPGYFLGSFPVSIVTMLGSPYLIRLEMKRALPGIGEQYEGS